MTTTAILLFCLLFFILGAAAMRFGLGPALRERDEWRKVHRDTVAAAHRAIAARPLTVRVTNPREPSPATSIPDDGACPS